MFTRSLLILALVGVQSTAALGASPRNQTNSYRAWRIQAQRILVARGDSNSVATAAALSFAGSVARVKTPAQGSPALDLAARASDLAPQSPTIAWLRLSLCTASPGCDSRDAATAMRWVDADNGAAWLPTLAAAQKDKDTTEVDKILADMAQARHFDLYWNSIVVLMFDALYAARKQLPGGYVSSDSARYAAVSGLASSEIIPPFAPLVDACREAATVGERRELCLKLARTMQRADTIIAQMAGFSIEKRFLTPDSKQARAIGERRRVLEWRMTAAAKFDSPLLPWTKNSRARARIAQMRAMAREEDVCMAILRQHKMAIDPPEPHI
ncbi:MAG: hypothetical protein M3N50_04460 [Pseudomonadota bacterium]|nr:hypothetical protein [Pseudomonadota bacterium]